MPECYATSLRLTLAVGPRWRQRRVLNLAPPRNIRHRHPYLKHFLLRENWEPIGQLLHNKQERNHIENVGEPQELSGSWGNYPGLRNWWVPLFMFPLPLGSGQELHPDSLASLQGLCSMSPDTPTLTPELDPAGTGGHQDMHTKTPSTQRLIQQIR